MIALIIAGVALLALIAPTAAQTAQQCVCTTGCKIASAPFPIGPNLGVPESCSVYKMPGHTLLGSGPVVAADTAAGGIATSNAVSCLPADTAYQYGPVGSKACLVVIAAQPANSTVQIVLTATNAKGESGDSSPYTFQSVPALAILPSVPLTPRVSP